MLRPAAAILAAFTLTAAERLAPVEYRLAIAPDQLSVELRLRGDADGETRLVLPPGAADLRVQGGSADAAGVLRHRPNARLTVRYRLAADPGAVRLGEVLFAHPQGRGFDPATVRLGKLPAGWRLASDLEHERGLRVADVVDSVLLAGPDVSVAEQAGDRLRIAVRGAQTLPPALAETLAAQRAFWRETGPYLVVVEPAAPGRPASAITRGDGLVLQAAPGDLGSRWQIAHAHTEAVVATRLARAPAEPAAPWFTQGFTDFLTNRALARAGLEPPAESSARISDALAAYDLAPISKPAAVELAARRGALLALKWDEDVRRRSGGKLDLDDVVLRMRDHYAQFPPGEGPALTDSLVSAAWVVAGLDLRDDLQLYVARGQSPPVPDTLFGGCLELRSGTRPLYDTGFDHAGSIAAKTVRGVARYGPAYASGLRNGMRLETWTISPDTSREMVLTVRDARGRGRARTIRYWPYSDTHLDVRRLQLKPQMGQADLAACGRKLGGA